MTTYRKWSLKRLEKEKRDEVMELTCCHEAMKAGRMVQENKRRAEVAVERIKKLDQAIEEAKGK